MMKEKTEKTGVSRRHFITTAVSAGLYSIIPRQGRARLHRQSAADKLNIAGIGIGGMGSTNLRNLENENIVALCDVDPSYAAKTAARYPKASFYKDYRILLEKQKDLDAVVIATPDHTHAKNRLPMTSVKRAAWPQLPARRK